jgi:hypothetical protein
MPQPQYQQDNQFDIDYLASRTKHSKRGHHNIPMRSLTCFSILLLSVGCRVLTSCHARLLSFGSLERHGSGCGDLGGCEYLRDGFLPLRDKLVGALYPLCVLCSVTQIT